MDQQSVNMEPLARCWEKATLVIGKDRFAPEVMSLVRLAFFLGARCAIDHVWNGTDRAMALLMLRMELRGFDRKVDEPKEADDGQAHAA